MSSTNSQTTIADLIEDFGIAPKLSPQSDGDYRLLKASAIRDGQIDPQLLEPADTVRKSSMTKHILRNGDVLFQAKGSVLQAYSVTTDIANMVASQMFFWIRPDTAKILPEFLCWYLNSRYVQDELERQTSGAVVKHVKRDVLLGLELNPPPIAEQQHFVRLLSEFSTERTLTLDYLQTRKTLIEARILTALGAYT